MDADVLADLDEPEHGDVWMDVEVQCLFGDSNNELGSSIHIMGKDSRTTCDTGSASQIPSHLPVNDWQDGEESVVQDQLLAASEVNECEEVSSHHTEEPSACYTVNHSSANIEHVITINQPGEVLVCATPDNSSISDGSSDADYDPANDSDMNSDYQDSSDDDDFDGHASDNERPVGN